MLNKIAYCRVGVTRVPSHCVLNMCSAFKETGLLVLLEQKEVTLEIFYGCFEFIGLFVMSALFSYP